MDHKICFYDVESTGFGPKDEVIQIAGIITSWDLKIHNAFNYFTFTNCPIDPRAREVHGLDINTVYKLSNGRYLEQIMDNELRWFREEQNIIFVAYNDEFDKRLINQTLIQNNCDGIDFGKKVHCLPRKASGRFNLDACALFAAALNNNIKWKLETYSYKKTKYTMDQIISMYKYMTSTLKVPTREKAHHDALFDAFIMWLIMAENRVYMYG